MSAAAAVLPFVWANAAYPMIAGPVETTHPMVPAGMAFYRRYTEGLLRRYLRLSLEVGKVPSLLGKEMFRGKVTSYRVGGFDDAVIFTHDVERCLERLDEPEQNLIARIALQQFTIEEAAAQLGVERRTIIRRYRQAIDRLTRVFLSVGVLQPRLELSRG